MGYNLTKRVLLTVIVSALCAFGLQAQQSSDRDSIDAKYKWDLTEIYQNWDEWEAGFAKLEKMMDEVAALKGTLTKGPDALFHALKLSEDLDMLSYLVFRYPQFHRVINGNDQNATAQFQRVNILFSKFGTATAWINPEMLTIPWETMKQWLETTPGLEPFRFDIEDLYRQQAHVLDEEKEKIISYYSGFNQTPRTIYEDLSTADIDYPTVTLSDGSEVKATMGNYSRVLATNMNQADRKTIFEAHYNTYKANKNTYASIYNSICQRDWANAQARNYNSTLEANLDNNNIPVAVYENLVNTVRENTAPLQKFTKLRAKVLGLEEYHQYDGSIPITDYNETYPYEDATKMVLESVAPLGDDYQKRVATALQGGWIDVFENTGKQPGAFSAGVYGVHPYMMLNYNETMNYVFTLGHEIGHTIHTMLANENQPFSTSSYTLFVAEVASTFNERLLLDYWLDKTDNPKERIALLLQAINNIQGTFYFQSLLADYELQVHKLVEQGKPVTAEVLNRIMKDLFTTYYGDSAVHDDLMDVVWARISHFYRVPYYVYQYATCFASSALIYDDIKAKTGSEKEEALDRYLNLLKSGGNDYPMNQLMKAGVDLSTPAPYLAIINQFDKLVDQLEVEINKL